MVFGFMILINSKGLRNGANLGCILAVISLFPLMLITLAPFFTGDFHLANITGAWESAAIFGPEYKNPNTDTPRSLLVY